MVRIVFALLVLASTGLAQSSSDKSFSVRHSKHENFSLSSAQMREAESLYRSACVVVEREFHSAGELHPHFTVIIGADRDEILLRKEIRMRAWNPTMFAQGVVVLAFDQVLTDDVIVQLATRAVRHSNAMVDVAGLK